MRAVMWAELRMHPRRVVSAGLAVLMGVAFVVAGLGATATMKGFIKDSVAARADRSDVVVSADEFSSLPEKAVKTVREANGVQHAEVVRKTSLEIAYPDRREYASVMSAPVDPRLRWMDIESGRLPRGAGEIAVDSGSAHEANIKVGDVLPVTPVLMIADGKNDEPKQRPQEKAKVVGVLNFHMSPEIIGRTVLALDAEVARWGDASPSEIDVLGVPGTDPAALKDTLTRAVAVFTDSQVFVRTGPEEAQVRASSLTGDVDVVGALLLGFAGVALLVASLVISNTFAIILAQRTRQMALLRCVGATRKQIFRSVLAEAAAIGVIASLLGIVVGTAFTLAGTWMVGQTWPDASTTARMPLPGVVVAFVVGVLVTLVASMLPARRATKVAALAALRPETVADAKRTSRVRVIFGLLAGVVGCAALFLGTQTGEGSAEGPGTGIIIGIFGGGTALLGVLLTGPVLVPVLARLLGRPFQASGPAGSIAVGNAVRNPGRASATSTALLVGVCLMTTITVGSACVTQIGSDELNSNFPVDMAVTTPLDGKISQSKVQQITQVEGVEKSAAVWRHLIKVKTPAGLQESLGQAGDPSALASVIRDGKGPKDDTILMGPGFLETFGLTAGQKVEVVQGKHSVTLTLGIANVEGALLTDKTLSVLTPRNPTSEVWVKAEKGADAGDLQEALEKAVNDVPDASVDGVLAQRAVLEQVMSILMWIAVGLLGVALVIAIVGIGNTLSLSVLERTRELGVQRALGMTRKQLRLSLALEAFLLAAVGTVVGVVLGVGFGWVGTRTLLAGTVTNFPLVVPVTNIALICGVAAAAGVMASFLPSRRASRIPPTQALATE